jgi:hypothetical protein
MMRQRRGIRILQVQRKGEIPGSGRQRGGYLLVD